MVKTRMWTNDSYSEPDYPDQKEWEVYPRFSPKTRTSPIDCGQIVKEEDFVIVYKYLLEPYEKTFRFFVGGTGIAP